MPDATEADGSACVITRAAQPAAQHPATAGPGTVRVPPHPVPALTTYELREFRRQLEHALADQVIGRAPIARRLRETLAEVLAEEQSRARLHQANGASP